LSYVVSPCNYLLLNQILISKALANISIYFNWIGRHTA